MIKCPWKLYIDDLRTPVDEDFIVIRSVEEAKRVILSSCMPIFISFDHDLGIDEDDKLLPSGYDFAKWLVESDIAGIIQFPSDFAFEVHSRNPVGAKNIKMLLEGYLKFKKHNKI
jgi:hypothetical protein